MRTSIALFGVAALVLAPSNSHAQNDAFLLRTSVATKAMATTSVDVSGAYGSEYATASEGSEEWNLEMSASGAAVTAKAAVGDANVTGNAQGSIAWNLGNQSISNFSGITQHAIHGRDSAQYGDYIGGGNTAHLGARATHVADTGGAITSGYGDFHLAWSSAGTYGGDAWFTMFFTMEDSWTMTLCDASVSIQANQSDSNVFASNGGMVWVPNDIDGGQLNVHMETTVAHGAAGLLDGTHSDTLGAMMCGVPMQVNTMQAGAQVVLIAGLSLTSPTDGVGTPTRFTANGFEIDGWYE